jgi:hypothetical protein
MMSRGPVMLGAPDIIRTLPAATYLSLLERSLISHLIRLEKLTSLKRR